MFKYVYIEMCEKSILFLVIVFKDFLKCVYLICVFECLLCLRICVKCLDIFCGFKCE